MSSENTPAITPSSVSDTDSALHPVEPGINRSTLLKFGAATAWGTAVAMGAAVSPVSAAGVPRAHGRFTASAVPLPGVLDLYINEGYTKMVDDSLVYQRGFGDRPTALRDARPSLRVVPKIFTREGQVVESRTYPLGAAIPPNGTPAPAGADPANPGQFFIRRNHWASFFPQRTIIVESGATVRLRVFNGLAGTHQLTVAQAAHGRSDLSTGPIAPGGQALLEFDAPYAGTYIYYDPTNAPVQRALGLFGTILVMDPDDPWRVAPNQMAFERQWLWMTHAIDTTWARIEAAGGTVNPLTDPAVPRYFMLNDRSGYEALGHSPNRELNRLAHEESLISGYPRQVDIRNFGEDLALGTLRGGQAVRMVNPGIASHQMHFHGNHLWTVRRNNVEWPREFGHVDADGHVVLQQWEDVIELPPMDRKDCIIPLKRPPDATDKVWYNRTEDWKYPMHCHAEMSQTAAGGMYPGGLVAHWELKSQVNGG